MINIYVIGHSEDVKKCKENALVVQFIKLFTEKAEDINVLHDWPSYIMNVEQKAKLNEVEELRKQGMKACFDAAATCDALVVICPKYPSTGMLFEIATSARKQIPIFFIWTYPYFSNEKECELLQHPFLKLTQVKNYQFLHSTSSITGFMDLTAKLREIKK